MKLTQRQKIYVAVLVVAAVGLLVDQVFLGGGRPGPEQAVAAPAAPAAEGATAPTAMAVVASPASPAGAGLRSVADRLTRFAEGGGPSAVAVRDAFLPSKSWLAELSPEATKDHQARKLAETFKRTHRLTAVLAGSGGGTAIVDNQCLRVGESLDGFSLQSVGTHSAVFVSGDQRVRLDMPGLTGRSPRPGQTGEKPPPSAPSPVAEGTKPIKGLR